VERLLPEDTLRDAVEVLVRIVEAGGAVIIFAGAVVGFARFLVAALGSRSHSRFVAVRLGLGRFLALGLEFQLAGDILRTAVAPTFEEIGQLAAIAAIRTALNYFLERELEAERREIEAHPDGEPADAATRSDPG
jgi:uncharacterized membrane protein